MRIGSGDNGREVTCVLLVRYDRIAFRKRGLSGADIELIANWSYEFMNMFGSMKLNSKVKDYELVEMEV